jgi:hypothetical protein
MGLSVRRYALRLELQNYNAKILPNLSSNRHEKKTTSPSSRLLESPRDCGHFPLISGSLLLTFFVHTVEALRFPFSYA